MKILEFLENNFDYFEYIKKNSLHQILGLDAIPNDPSNQIAFPAEFDDLSRLHFITRKRKVSTVLEFGVGKSTLIFANALKLNKREFNNYYLKNLRKKNLFEIHSIDNYAKWIEECKKNIQNSYLKEGIVNLHFSNLLVGEFSGRVCTYYEKIPNIAPDLIYLDGPDQFSSLGDIRGISTRHQDRFPMAADILSFEHFLHPGTLLIVDGRTANARFIRCNLQRNWTYFYHESWDQHFFELVEKPLGKYNKLMIDFCLGDEFYKSLEIN